MVGNLLKEKYSEITKMLNIDNQASAEKINLIIKKSLENFTRSCQNPAIWCYGKHTKMLMVDYIYEMKNVKYIIDNNVVAESQSGFCIIRQDEIKERKIDGIIISSFKFRQEIKEILKREFPDIRYLDIYEEMEHEGIQLSFEYFSQTHPYCHYMKINELQRKLQKAMDKSERRDILLELIRECVNMKDFQFALVWVGELRQFGDSAFTEQLQTKIGELYQAELQAAEGISENNVLMVCVDGLRRRDFMESKMPQLYEWSKEKAFLFENAFSMSTSTYESLIPTFSENDDLRTRYYDSATISEKECRFFREAVKQGRTVRFYTDGMQFIDSKYVVVSAKSLTAAEKLWEFVNDAAEEKNGLYYIHFLYESHFSYPNSYTTDKVVADGTSIFFDFMEIAGGKLKTDYVKQQKDALHYMDDLLYPFFKRLKCRMVIFADHGNVLFDKDFKLSDVERTQLSFADELIEIPLIVKSPEYGCGENHQLESLKSLNDIVIQLLQGVKRELAPKKYIKVLRSHIYNPDFQYLYKKCNHEQELMAFELFIFEDGSRIAVYEDGSYEVISNKQEIAYYLKIIQDEITVCSQVKQESFH